MAMPRAKTEPGDLLMLTGPPGSGKSTVARHLGQMFELCAVVPGDGFYGFITAGGILPWLADAAGQNRAVTEALGAAAGRLVRAGYTVVVEGVVGPWLLPDFQTFANTPRLHYAILLPDLRECLTRVAERPDHGFRDAAVTRQLHEAFERDHTFERHQIRRPAEAPRATAEAVMGLVESGDLLLQSEQ